MSLFGSALRLTHSRLIPRQKIPQAITTNLQQQHRFFRSTTANMVVHNIANRAEFETTIKDNKIVIIDAFAEWCGPCKAIAPHVEKFSEQFTGAHFIKIDVDEVPDVAQELGIRAMPTFIIFKDGEKVQQVMGANPKGLLAAIETTVA